MAILMVSGPGGPAAWLKGWLADIDGAVLVAPGDPAPSDRAGWLALLAEAVQRHPGAVLVGHGAGALLIAHLAAERPELPVGAALLVSPVVADGEAGADGDAAALPPGLAPLPVRPFAFPSVLVAGPDGPGLDADRARVLANLWEAALVGPEGPEGEAPGERASGWPAGRRLLARLDRLAAGARPRPPVHTDRRLPADTGRTAA